MFVAREFFNETVIYNKQHNYIAFYTKAILNHGNEEYIFWTIIREGCSAIPEYKQDISMDKFSFFEFLEKANFIVLGEL